MNRQGLTRRVGLSPFRSRLRSFALPCLYFCLAGFLFLLQTHDACAADDFTLLNAASVKDKADGGRPGKDKSMNMYTKSVDEALEEFQDNPRGAEEILARENTPLALCYRAYLRESGALRAGGPEDSAEALLEKAQKELPEELYRQATDNTDWGGGTPTMNRIINTLFILHAHNIKPR